MYGSECCLTNNMAKEKWLGQRRKLLLEVKNKKKKNNKIMVQNINKLLRK